MIPLPRLQLKAMQSDWWTDPQPQELLQECLNKDPWKVAVASMLLNRTTRRQAESALIELLHWYSDPESLCRADETDVAPLIRSCGFQRTRARRLIRFSAQWLGDGWEDLRELTGVGVYVADAVGLVCFGCTELESQDGALRARVAAGQAAVGAAEAAR